MSAIACAVVLVGIGAVQAFAQTDTKQVPAGQELKVLGIINTRGAETFTMTTLDGADRYVVHLDPATSVKSNTKGVFRGGENYGASYLLRGLRVEVKGRGNARKNLSAI